MSNLGYSADHYAWCQLGIRGIIVSAASTTADTPRAHITNMAAMGMSVSPDQSRQSQLTRDFIRVPARYSSRRGM